MFTIHREEIDLNGKTLALETGKIARQALSAVMASYGDTRVLCALTAAPSAAAGTDFLPLSVHYQEKFFAAGKIPGGFLKRENKPSDREVLASRLIDRSIRPLFAKDFHHEVQVMCTVLSLDENADPLIAAMMGASAVCSLSGLPFKGPVATVRLGARDQESFLMNPPKTEGLILDLVISATKEGIVMVESESKELEEEFMVRALMHGHQAAQPLIQMIQKLAKTAGRPPFVYEQRHEEKQSLWQTMVNNGDWKKICSIPNTEERNQALRELKATFAQEWSEEAAHQLGSSVFYEIWRTQARHHILQSGKRLDGRPYDKVRSITCEVGLLPRVHGSALFTRGDTQALATATLGSTEDGQLVDGLTGTYRDAFMLHYNFPAYSVGEVGRVGSPGRRELGHGKLAWRALQAVLPPKLPYTVRLVSDITESDGSSSMATVCGGTLALMDAGVSIIAPVAGIAMGLIRENASTVEQAHSSTLKDSSGEVAAILSDISGTEDNLGDMDFKVAGTAKGITALQMDLKGDSLSETLLAHILGQAKEGRNEILQAMNTVLDTPREVLSPYAPSMTTLKISTDKIRDLIGPGGKVIRELCAATQSKINIEDDGTVSIFSPNEEASAEAVARVHQLTGVPIVGETYQGTVVKLMEFGAFVDYGFPQDGMVHISEIAPHRIEDISSVLTVGDKVKVKLIGVDNRGRTKLSIRQAEA